MIVIYKTIPKIRLKKLGKEALTKCEEFLASNPKRRVCRFIGWYNQMITVRRGHVKEDVDAAVAKAQNGK